MRQVKVLLFAVLVVLVAASAVMAEGMKIISGYSPGEFALKGDILLQVEKIAKQIEAEKREGVDLQIDITGTTDKTGHYIYNDHLGLARAEQVKAYLASKFPNAKINCWSSGQDPNVRQVWVRYAFFTEGKNMSIDISSERLLFLLVRFGMGITLAGVIVVGYLIFITVFRKKSNKEIPTTTAETSKRPEGLNGVSWITVNDCKVLIERREGKFVSPFRAKGGGEIIRDDREGMISSLKGCLKSSAFAEQKERLIKEDKIRIISYNNSGPLGQDE